jgi:hypothetical protein
VLHSEYLTFWGKKGQDRIVYVCHWFKLWRRLVVDLIWETADPLNASKESTLPLDSVVQVSSDG